MRGGRLLALALVASCLAPAPLPAQSRPPTRFTPSTSGAFAVEQPDTARPRVSAPAAALLSGVLPGAGEYALGLDRWVPQVALELFAWWQYREHRREGRSFEQQYRQVACQVSRRIDAAAYIRPGVCRDTSDFEYYEHMGKSFFPASGVYDRRADSAGVQPELDTLTYNGKQWLLAQQLYTDGAAALAYYERNGIHTGYLWDWGDNTLEQTVFDELIHRGDAAFRTSSRLLGLILANHVAGAVDAYIAGRLKEMHRPPLIQVRTGFEPVRGDVRWRAGVWIATGGP